MKRIRFLLVMMIVNTAFAQKDVADVAQFGVKADFQRIKVSLKGDAATGVGFVFSANDIGKVLVVKSARSYPAYSAMPLSLNAIIKSVKNSVATIESPHLQQAVNVQNADAYLATNNYDALQNALAYCAANGKKKLLLSFTGTAYATPYFSEKFKNLAKNDAGVKSIFTINGSFEISGISKTKTVLKIGSEDLVYVNPADEFNYDVFYLNTPPGSPVIDNKTFRNFTLEGTDRANTAVTNNNAAFRTSYGDNQVMQVLFDNVDIIGKGGMEIGFTTSRGGRWNADGTVKDFCQYTIRNCNWAVHNPLSVFAQVPENVANPVNGAKKVLVENTVFDGGGTPKMRKFSRSASANGNTLTITSPGFSFYDYNSYIEEKYRQPVITLEEAVETTVKRLALDVGVNRNIELNATVPVSQDFVDVYVYDKNGNETFIQQRTNTRANSNTIYAVTYETGAKFQPGNRIRVVFRKVQCQVKEILSPTTARIEWIGTVQQTFKNVTAIVNDDGRTAEGHTMYIHPNVSCSFVNLTIKNSLKLALHHYSGGGVRGSRLFFELDGVTVIPTNNYPLERGLNYIAPFEFTMLNCIPQQPIIINNSSLAFYQTEAWIKASNTKLLGGQCAGGSFEKCTGNVDIWGNYPTLIKNCKLEGYNSLRPKEADKLNATISNSSFGWLSVGAVHSLNISNSKIDNYIVTAEIKPFEKQRIKLDKVIVVNKQ